MRQPRLWVSVTCGAILCAAWGATPSFAYRDNISYDKTSTEEASAPQPRDAATAAPAQSAPAESMAPATRSSMPPAERTAGTATTRHAMPASPSAASTGGKQNSNISTGTGRSAHRKRGEAARTSITGKYKGARTNRWRELALSGDPDALDKLLKALQYYPGVAYSMPNTLSNPLNSIRTRRQAAEALGILGDEGALRALEDALNDPDFLVRQHAARSIAIITERNR